MNSSLPKKQGGGNGVLQVGRCVTTSKGLWYDMVCPPKWISPSGFGDKIRLQNGFCLRVEATLSRYLLLTSTPHKNDIFLSPAYAETHKGTIRNPH